MKSARVLEKCLLLSLLLGLAGTSYAAGSYYKDLEELRETSKQYLNVVKETEIENEKLKSVNKQQADLLDIQEVQLKELSVDLKDLDKQLVVLEEKVLSLAKIKELAK